MNMQIVSNQGGNNAEMDFKTPSEILFDNFKLAVTDSTNSLYTNIKNYINSGNVQTPSVTLTKNSTKNHETAVTLTFMSGLVLTINVSGFKS